MLNIIRYIIILLSILFTRQAIGQVFFGDYALTGVTVIDGKTQKPLLNQTILVKKNIIAGIFTSGSVMLPDTITIINLKGKFVLPGLIDTHVHLATDPTETKRPAIEEQLTKMLYSGITAVRDMAGDARTLAGLSRDALVNDINSPDIYYSALMAGPEFFSDPRTAATTRGVKNGAMPYMRAITDSTDLALIVAEAKESGATGIKLYANLSSGLVKKVVEEADKQNIRVWSHAALFPAKPSEIVQAGVQVISHAPMLCYERYAGKEFVPAQWKQNKPAGNNDMFWNNEAGKLKLDTLFKTMKQKGTIFDATLSVYKDWSEENPQFSWQLEMGYSIVREAHKAGVKICTGTDTDQKSLVQEEMKLLVKQAGFTPLEAIIAATLYSAEAIGISDTRGTIEKNKVADLLILEKNPVDDINNIDSILMVIKAGKIFRKP